MPVYEFIETIGENLIYVDHYHFQDSSWQPPSTYADYWTTPFFSGVAEIPLDSTSSVFLHYGRNRWYETIPLIDGVIFLASSVQPEYFYETKIIFSSIENRFDVPTVVGAVPLMLPLAVRLENSQIGEAWELDALQIALRIPEEIPLVTCDVRDKRQCASVLITLAQSMIETLEKGSYR